MSESFGTARAEPDAARPTPNHTAGLQNAKIQPGGDTGNVFAFSPPSELNPLAHNPEDHTKRHAFIKARGGNGLLRSL